MLMNSGISTCYDINKMVNIPMPFLSIRVIRSASVSIWGGDLMHIIVKKLRFPC